MHVEWDSGGHVTPLGQLPFFIEYLKQAGLFDGWVADCPLTFSSPNAPSKRDLVGTVLLSILAGHNRYAHITALRSDAVNPRLLGMKKVLSEDAVRRGLAKIDAAAGLAWLQTHLDYCPPAAGRALDPRRRYHRQAVFGHRKGRWLATTRQARPSLAQLPQVS